MRDNSLARHLIDDGHDVTMLPAYLPHLLDEENASSETPVFLGGINVYLQHKFPFFRKTPKWLDYWLNSKFLLRWVAGKRGMTTPRQLGEITLSTFRAKDGPLAKEVNKMIDWFREYGKPDVLILSTILLAGVGRAVREELNIPVIGFLQGEDGFLDSLLPEYREDAWKLLTADVHQLDGCISPSQYFGKLMAERLNLDISKVLHHPNGITTEGFSSNVSTPLKPTLGFLARLCPLKGLDILVDAFIILKNSGEHPELCLEIAGGMTDEDKPFVEEQKSKLVKAGYSNSCAFHPNIKRAEKLTFLRDLSVFSVPSRYPEAFGLYVVESMAAGTPVVLPNSGAFPEIVEDTNGGIIYEDNSPEALAQAIEKLLLDINGLNEMGGAGCEAVLHKYSNEHLAHSLIDNILAPALASF
jgi:glycosyltransferase involved in cell wall biosynthesis